VQSQFHAEFMSRQLSVFMKGEPRSDSRRPQTDPPMIVVPNGLPLMPECGRGNHSQNVFVYAR
jgi:hypothetical protein